jgi:Ras-related protein Rab-2A
MHTHAHTTPRPTALAQLWDTAGQERFRTIAVAYFRGANAIMLVFDLTMRTSFAAVESWVRDIDKNADKRVAKILVGNKADLAEMPGEGLGGQKRAISVAEATACAKAHGMTYIETSAKSGANVDTAFERLAGLALDNLKREKEDTAGRPAPAAAKTVTLGGGKKEGGDKAEKKSWGC